MRRSGITPLTSSSPILRRPARSRLKRSRICGDDSHPSQSSSTPLLAPSTINAIVRLAKSGVEHVVLSRFDDEPRRFLELLEGIPGSALGDRMLHELAGPLSTLAGHRCSRDRSTLSIAGAFQECTRSRRCRGHEPPHAVPKSGNRQEFFRRERWWFRRGCYERILSAGSRSIDQGRGSKGRISLAVAVLAAASRVHRTHGGASSARSKPRSARRSALAEQVRRRRRKE